MDSVRWIYYPRSNKAPELALQVVEVFKNKHQIIDSSVNEHKSNDVLAHIKNELEHIGFKVEKDKTQLGKIPVPVLFGLNGRIEKSFDADAYHADKGFVLEVEAGRAVVNYQFLKDFFQACMMNDVQYLAIAVRNSYRNRGDFEIVMRFFDTMYASNRMKIPLEGILIIGY